MSTKDNSSNGLSTYDTLDKVAEELYQNTKQEKSGKDTRKRVQLIYAFNGTGKTRLSGIFKDKVRNGKDGIIYYSAFTEDLFYWDNDLRNSTDRYLMIQENKFTRWVLEDRGQEGNISKYLQEYTTDKLSIKFDSDYKRVSFSIATGDDKAIENIKISKGEESCFIWCLFYSILKEIIEERNTGDDDNDDKEWATLCKSTKYIFIDDPVSSQDEGHLIKVAVDIAELIKADFSEMSFIITTHNPLFYNILWNELNNSGTEDKGGDRYKPKRCQRSFLLRRDDGSYLLKDSNDTPFSHHITLLQEIIIAIKNGNQQKFHFSYLRQILEKTATFLGYEKWIDLLPANNIPYYNRIINLSSHSKVSSEEVGLLNPQEKALLEHLLNHLYQHLHFKNPE